MKVSALIIVGMLLSSPAYATSESKARNINILMTSALAVITAYVYGEIHNFEDLTKVAAVGAVGGYGFYESRKIIAKGNIEQGLAMSYFSSSIVENTTLGLHPLSHIRYGVGPIELRLTTPFATQSSILHQSSASHQNAIQAYTQDWIQSWLDSDTWLHIDVDYIETVYALDLLANANSVGIKRGLLYGKVDKVDIDGINAIGEARGRSVVFRKDYFHDETLWRHEAIHVSQAIQMSSFLDPHRRRNHSSATGIPKVRLGLRANYTYGALLLTEQVFVPYEQRWSEREVNALLDPH